MKINSCWSGRGASVEKDVCLEGLKMRELQTSSALLCQCRICSRALTPNDLQKDTSLSRQVEPLVCKQLLRRRPVPRIHLHNLANELFVLSCYFLVLKHREWLAQVMLFGLGENPSEHPILLGIYDVLVTEREWSGKSRLLYEDMNRIHIVVGRYLIGV